jgi:hypothetical protein
MPSISPYTAGINCFVLNLVTKTSFFPRTNFPVLAKLKFALVWSCSAHPIGAGSGLQMAFGRIRCLGIASKYEVHRPRLLFS